jgi:diguanylate cyclase (GGDEF)-like protein
MGRALGVLHSTGPNGEPLERERIAQLTTLATQAGTRIGTVRAFERTQLQAATDELTGLDNRRNLERQLRRLIVHRRPFALALGDLDDFKLLNDKHGHEAGDRALRLFAQVALDALREQDQVGRWGGEEFVVILPDLDQAQALPILDRLRERLAASHTGEHPRFTASFGVTDSTRAATVQELVQLADAALYTAKQSGRDQAWADSGLTQAPGGRNGASPAGDPRNENGSKSRVSRAPLLADDGADDDPRHDLDLR